LTTLDAIDHIDIAIDGADEVDPQKNLIKGRAARPRKYRLADQFML